MHIFNFPTQSFFHMATTTSEESNVINDALVQSIISDPNIKVEARSNEAIIPPEMSQNFINELSKLKGTNFKTAFAAAAIICQKGGTAKRASGDIHAYVNEKRVTLNDLRSVIKNNNWNFTLRQFARANANNIFAICSHYSISGDLAKKIMRNHENLNLNDSFWLSNFQMDNPSCPLELRQLLIQHYEQTFPDAGKTIKS